MRSTILKKYYDDQRWAYRHFPEEKKAIKSKFASIMFVEKGAHVYQDSA